jgi:hypothetical protein
MVGVAARDAPVLLFWNKQQCWQVRLRCHGWPGIYVSKEALITSISNTILVLVLRVLLPRHP